ACHTRILSYRKGDCMEPLADADVPRWWQRLGLPGVVDIHTHFLPERMLRRVWAHFDEVGPLIGRPWPIEYRWDQDRRLAHLRQMGVRRFTALTAVVAHLGAPEYAEFLTLAERYPRVHLDTTMVFTDFFEQSAPFPADLLPRLAALPDRVVLGSDFPNIPYPYAHQLEALERLREREPRLDDDWLRAVCWFNGHRLIGDCTWSSTHPG
ncbi:MAG: amidohydrolase family protein, partial [Dermatophilaceae bacterium]